MADSINSQEVLVLIGKWPDGSRFVLENEVQPYSAPEVQHLIDSHMSMNACQIVSVLRVDASSNTVEDITDDFDLPELPTYVGTPRAVQYNTLQAAE
jgi:hypothetical protein